MASARRVWIRKIVLAASAGHCEGVRRGNGKDGVVLRLDRLEQTETKRSRLMWLILGGVLILGIASVGQWLGIG